MEPHSRTEEISSLRDYLRVLRLRRWAIILPVILIPLAAVFISLQQTKLYQASADVYVSRQTQNFASAISGLPDPTLFEDPQRALQTQVELASVQDVAERVIKRAGVKDRTAGDLLANSTIAPKADVDFLTFSVTDPDPQIAARLATEYGREFVRFRQSLNTKAFANAHRELEERLAELEQSGRRNSRVYADLAGKLEQLRTVEALQTASTFLVDPAGPGVQVQPRPFRSGVLGLGIGLLFGLGLAFLWHALDTRVRSAEEISDRLALPLLARLPEPPRNIRRGHKLAMLAHPSGVHAEAFRLLRTNFEFSNLERGAQTVMFTSAVQAEGKSTTAGNLAVALARAGRRVVLVDLDLRRPFLDQFFDLQGQPGITDVALGHSQLEEALATIALTGSDPQNVRDNGQRASQGRLEVLASGPTPPDPGEFMETEALNEILRRLRERADVVLIDAAPLLGVGDALALSAKVDGLLLVTRLNVISRHMIQELGRVLAACPAAKLGFVLTGTPADGGYGAYTYYYAPREASKRRERIR
jgi:tyrosine-protein kinase